MDPLARVDAHFAEIIATQQRTVMMVAPAIVRAAEVLAACVRRGGKVLACGNGGSASAAQHFVGEWIGRLERERGARAALALTAETATLTAVANDYGYAEVFARQVYALGRAGDVLLAISTSGQSPNIIEAVRAAHEKGLAVIALSGRDGGALARALATNDVELRIPADRTMRIQEAHGVVIHCLCDLVDQSIAEEGD